VTYTGTTKKKPYLPEI